MNYSKNARVEDNGKYEIVARVVNTPVFLVFPFACKAEIDAAYVQSYDAGVAAYCKESERVAKEAALALRLAYNTWRRRNA